MPNSGLEFEHSRKPLSPTLISMFLNHHIENRGIDFFLKTDRLRSPCLSRPTVNLSIPQKMHSMLLHFTQTQFVGLIYQSAMHPPHTVLHPPRNHRFPYLSQ